MVGESVDVAICGDTSGSITGRELGEYLGAAETYMRLALKAQSQSRATITALTEIKPRVPSRSLAVRLKQDGDV